MKIGGRYEIIRKLGEGTFGITYLASDRQRPGSPHCVVKQLKLSNFPTSLLQKVSNGFDREAAVLEKLGSHDQIPRLLAHFEENQQFYLVQEYIEGNSLSEEITPGTQWTEEQAIALLREILEVLVHVQENNAIHRDLKPANIMRRQDGKIVLIDFGAVKEIGSQILNSQGQIPSTIIIGTPGYMPIEQLNGRPNLCSDIYAVGMIAIQALTGIYPTNLAEDANHEVVWRDRAPHVSDRLANIIVKMVRHHGSDRYQSADEVLQALSPPPPQPSPWKKVIIAGIVLAVGLSAIAAFFILTRGSKDFTYEDARYGLNIDYPETWEKKTGRGGVQMEEIVFFESPQGSAKTPDRRGTVSILVEDLGSSPPSLKAYTDNYLELIGKSFDLKETKSTTFANYPAWQIVFTGNNGTFQFKRLQVWTVKDDRAYVLTYTAPVDDYDKFEQTVQDMIESLEFDDD